MDTSIFDIQSILRIPASLRSPSHVDCLTRLTQDVQFFLRITSEQKSSQVHRECCKVMHLEEYSEDEIIFNFGDRGEKFYIILTGSVSVKLPAKRMVFVSKHAVNRIEKLLDDVKEDSCEEGQNEGLKKEGHLTVDVGQVMNAIKGQNKVERDLTSRTAILSAEEKTLLFLFKKKVKEEQKILLSAVKHSESDKLELEFEDLNEIGTLFSGGSFGELALISDRPRSATIQVREKSSFLVLNKSDFTRILGDIAEKKMTSTISYLQKVPYFHSRSKAALVRMAYYFQTKTFRKDRVIYKELDPVDGIYLIREGEVMLMKKKIIRFKSVSAFESSPTGFLAKQPRKVSETVQVKLIIKGSFDGFGGFEVIKSQCLRSYSCVCSSITCELLFMPKSIFLSRVPHLDLFKEMILNDHARIMQRFEESSEQVCMMIDKEELEGSKGDKGSKGNKGNKGSNASFAELGDSRSLTPTVVKGKSFITTPACRSVFKKKSTSQRVKSLDRASAFRKLTKKEISEAVNGRSSIMKRYGSRLSVNSSFSLLPSRLKTAASYNIFKSNHP